jgi:hypothetical protein
MYASTPRSWKEKYLPWLGFFLLVVATRLLLVANFANDMPFQDEWGHEAQQVFGPYLKGQLHFTDLFTVWVQHRILTTRLYELLMLWLDGGVWSPMQQMVGNAILQGSLFAGITALLMRACHPADRPIFFCLALLLFGLPLAYANILAGFQTQFYFCIGLSTIFLWSIVDSEPLTLPWLLGMTCGLLGLFSLAPGTLALACGALFLGLRYICGSRRLVDLWVALALLAPALISFRLTPTIFQDLAHTPAEFSSALLKAASWPAFSGFALLFYWPLVRFCWIKLRQPRSVTRPEWFAMLLALWVILQILSIAYVRSRAPTVSRYFEIFLLGLLINGLCMLSLERQRAIIQAALPEAERKPPPYMPFSQVWMLVLGLVYNSVQVKQNLDIKMALASRPFVSVRGYLQTHDFSYLADKDYPDLPYDNDRQLQRMLDEPTLRAILPPSLVPENASRQPALLRALMAHLSAIAIFFIAIGGICLGLSLRGVVTTARHAE